MQWGALLYLVWPAQISDVTGETRELWNGLVLAGGALVAMVVAPIAGALSDRSRNPRGRRRPYLLWGGLLNVVTLLFLGTVGKGSSFTALVLGIVAVQCAANWWGGPYAGLIPDLVAPAHRGLASGYMMVTMAFGWALGAVIAGGLEPDPGHGAVYAVLAAAMALGLVVALATVREPPGAARAAPVDWRAAAASFFPPLGAHRDFYWVLATRTAVGMGMMVILPYLEYYLDKVTHAPNALALYAWLNVGGGAIGVPLGFWAGKASDRVGRKTLVYASGALMALSALLYGSVAAHPSLAVLWVSAIAFGIGNNVYAAVDWAFALDSLPAQRNAGKDMGIWHVSLCLPQVLAPPISALLLVALVPVSRPFAYAMLFLVSALWFALGTIFVRRIRGIR